MSHIPGQQVYAKGGFTPRAKGQRRSPDLLPDFLGADGSVPAFAYLPQPSNPVVAVEQLGTFFVPSGFCKGETLIAYAVTLQSGLKVPAYSKGHQFNICQHKGFLAHG